jgi:hypothetical protein
MTGTLEVLTMGRIGVDVYPLQVGGPLAGAIRVPAATSAGLAGSVNTIHPVAVRAAGDRVVKPLPSLAASDHRDAVANRLALRRMAG